MNNLIVWFEIPVNDLKRAMQFYSQVMQIDLQVMEMGHLTMAFFPYSPGSASGALVAGSDNIPSEKGPLIYLNGGNDLEVPLSRVEKEGGKILQTKMSIGEHGYIAIFKDTEGNRIAFHSMN